MVIESDDHVGTDVGTAHWAIFASLGILSPGEVEAIDDWTAGATIGGRAIPDLPDLAADAERTFRAAAASARGAGRRRPGAARVQFGGLCDRRGRARPGWRPRGAVSPGGGCGEGRFGAAPLHALRRRGSRRRFPDDHLHGPLFPDLDDGIELFAAALADHFPSGARVGIDDQTHAMLRGLPGLTGSMRPMWSAPRSSQDTRRNRVHPQRAAAQRARDDRRHWRFCGPESAR